MKLLVNIGNTRTQVLLAGKSLRIISRFPTSLKGPQYRALVNASILGVGRPFSGVGIVSVVPARIRIWRAALKRVVPKTSVVELTPALALGEVAPSLRKIRYALTQLGPDRVANALGAIRSYPGKNCIVVDVGTAITIDAVSGERVFEGGVILAGPDLCLASLAEATGLLPRLSFSTPGRPPSNTDLAMRWGALHSVRGGIRDSIRQLSDHLNWKNPLVVGTGGAWTRLQRRIGESFIGHKDLWAAGMTGLLDAQ